jgi:RNA polymerase sigma factor (sigma-70 family)
MPWDEEKNRELKQILARFSGFIRAIILGFHPDRYGVDVEDVLQDVEIKLWKLLHNEKKIDNYSSYIKKIVETSVIDQFRKFKREEGIYLHEIGRQVRESAMGGPYEAPYIELDLKDLVGKAVGGLIESRRKVVQLYLLNMSIEEISLYFHWSRDKTRNLLYRGLHDLKRILKEKNIDYEHQP